MQNWIFTFGYGHYHPITNKPMRYYYVKILANSMMEARDEMTKRFGLKWSMQYETEEQAGVQKYHLKEYI